AGHHSSLTELLDGSALLVDVHNPKDIAVSVHALLQDGELRERLRERQRIVCRQFSWKKTAAEMREVFVSVVNRHAHRN
ncbi:MAG: hypothetical protein V1778_02385, partial [bacterium]